MTRNFHLTHIQAVHFIRKATSLFPAVRIHRAGHWIGIDLDSNMRIRSSLHAVPDKLIQLIGKHRAKCSVLYCHETDTAGAHLPDCKFNCNSGGGGGDVDT